MNDQQRSFAIQSFLAVLILNGLLLGAIWYLGDNILDPLILFGGGGVLSLFLWLSVLFSGNRAIADAARTAIPPPQTAQPPVEPAPVVPEPQPEPRTVPPPPPSDLPAVQILSILQRKGRLIDFLQENLDQYDDAQIGAAVRPIHAGCKEALAEHVRLEPIYREAEGSQITVEPGFDANAVRLVGAVSGEPPFRGRLTHRGWRAAEVNLPQRTSEKEKVVAPAEVEVG